MTRCTSDFAAISSLQRNLAMVTLWVTYSETAKFLAVLLGGISFQELFKVKLHPTVSHPV